MVGIHANTARFHLESLVDAGMATREQEASAQPGRRRILYSGTLPNQAHERAQGYRLLAQILTKTIAAKSPEVGAEMYDVGVQWGSYLTSRPLPGEVLDEATIDQRVLDNLDALWFAPELMPPPKKRLVFHNCPFLDAATNAPEVVCRLHAGMVNGALAEVRSKQRVVELIPFLKPHLCCALLGPVAETAVQPVVRHRPESDLPDLGDDFGDEETINLS
ncbi:MAG: hypothetical protein LBI33_13470 [Propionibacteriaceae bacterium]|nr:hypothetical protein [Propionibacteriaceae bacterium]